MPDQLPEGFVADPEGFVPDAPKQQQSTDQFPEGFVPDPIDLGVQAPPEGVPTLIARGQTYGPIVGEYGHDQMVGPEGNRLGTSDVALSPDYQKAFPLGSYVYANGKGPYRVADSSYVSPGRPNSATIEFRDTVNPPDHVALTPAPTPEGEPPQPGIKLLSDEEMQAAIADATREVHDELPDDTSKALAAAGYVPPDLSTAGDKRFLGKSLDEPLVQPDLIRSLLRATPPAMITEGEAAATGSQKLNDAYQGSLDAASQMASGLTTPKNIALLAAIGPLSEAPGFISKAVSLGFGAQAAQDMYQRTQQLIQQGANGTRDAFNQMTGIVLDGAMTTAIGAHILKPKPEVPTIQAKVATGPFQGGGEVPLDIQPQPQGAQPNATSGIAGATRLSQPEVRPQVGESPPLRQQGQTTGARPSSGEASAQSEQGTAGGPVVPPEQLSPDQILEPGTAYEYKKGQIANGQTILDAQNMAIAAGKRIVGNKGELHHAATVLSAALDGKPVNAAAVERYGTQLPDGYTREGKFFRIQNRAQGAVSGPEPVAQWTGATANLPSLSEQPLPPPINEPPQQFTSGLPMPKYEQPKFKALDKATGQRSSILQQSTQEALKARTDLRKAVPNKARREAISAWIEAGGDQATLKDWASRAKSKWMKNAATNAQKLTARELLAANRAKAAFDTLGARGNAAGVLGELRDNYVTHAWKVQNPFKGFGARALKQRFAFAKARTFNTFFDGDQAGFTPRTMDVSDLLPGYISELNRVIADRHFVNSIVGQKASDGTPLVIPRGRVDISENDKGTSILARPNAQNLAKDAAGNPIDQSKYRVMQDQPALRRWRWKAQDTQGNPIFMEGDLALHPEAYKRINAMIGESGLRRWYREEASGIAQFPRAFVRAIDVSQSVLKREMFSLIPPFHQVQEGTHAIGHRVNPFFGLERVDTTRPDVQDAMTHGLQLLSDRTSSNQYFEGLGGGHNTFLTQALRKIPGVGDTLAEASTAYQRYVFGSYIPALKWATYKNVVARNLHVFDGELKAGTISPADVKLLSAQQVNAAYGHLNYAMLDRNPTVQHFLQLGLLAPDFLEARGRFVAQAVKGITDKTGREQLIAVGVLAAAQAGISYTLAQLTGGEWDPKRPFQFSKNGRSYSMRSVPEDLTRLITDTHSFVSARLNPTLQTLDQIRTARNWRGEQVSLKDTLEEYIAKYIPIMARSAPGLRELTATSRNSPVSPLEQFAGSAGLTIKRFSPISNTHQLAHDWMNKQGIPPDTGIYPTSKYTPLRYALEDNDTERAKAEYQKLAATMDDTAIRKGFRASVNHPFTKSKSMDDDFADSLKPEDKAIYDLAKNKQDDILARFDDLPQ